MRAQLLCIGPLMHSERDAANVDQRWGALFNACHVDTCQPTPGAAEVHAWLNDTELLCRLLARRAGRAPPTHAAGVRVPDLEF